MISWWCRKMGSSPHTRGAHDVSTSCWITSGIIPAYAGSTGLCNLGPEATPDHPRIRGEHPVVCVAEAVLMGSSPHTRGALQSRMRASGQPRIIPAYAGST